MLVCFASLIRQKLRAPDVVARIEDGTFGLVLPESDETTARAVCQRVASEIHTETQVQFEVRLIEADPAGDLELQLLSVLRQP